jgi:hypothetical protein
MERGDLDRIEPLLVCKDGCESKFEKAISEKGHSTKFFLSFTALCDPEP